MGLVVVLPLMWASAAAEHENQDNHENETSSNYYTKKHRLCDNQLGHVVHTKCGRMKRFFKIVFVVCCKYSNTPKCKKMLGAREWSLICNPKLSKRKLTSQCCREGCTLPQIMSQCYRRR